MEFRTLGPLEVLDGGEPVDLGPLKQRSLLALLLINANEVVSTDRIIEALWGDEASGKESALWVHVSRLRSALEPDREGRGESSVLRTREPGYVLAVDDDARDVIRFEKLASAGRALVSTDPDAAAESLAEALGLWRGPALDDFAYESFARGEIDRLTELRVAAVEDRTDADLARGLSGELVSELESIVTDHPLRGRPVGQLMLALHRSSRQAEALRVFERFRRTLVEELGIDPPADLQRLEEQILVQDARLEPRISGRAKSGVDLGRVNPFKGLRPFLEDDADDFYGRDRLVAEMVRTLGNEQQILGVVGPSGSGKSSVVRAGLVPALRKGAIPGSDGWLIAQMMPGAHPFAEAEAALLRSTLDAPDSLTDQIGGDDAGLLRAAMRVLPDDSAKLILVIDQFEELFTLVDDENLRRRFLANLITAVTEPHGRIHLVLTLRADLYDRPLQYPEFGALLSGSVVNVTPLTAEELEAAALQPVTDAGVTFEPALLAQLIRDVVDQPGSLPLFQYTLTELFDRRAGDTLMMSTYRAMGGVNGALSRRADDLFRELDREQSEAARQVFLRLVTVTGDGERSRRRVRAGEIVSLDADVVAMQQVIEQFGQHRLLAFDADPATGAPTIEIAHEALLTAWEQYQTWIDHHEADLRQLASLRVAVDEWSRADENPEYLLTGARLIEIERWSAVSPLTLTDTERRFLDDGADHRRGDEEVEARRQQRENRRLRIALVAVVVGLAAAVVAGGLALVQRNRADDSASASETRRLASEAVAQVDTDRRLALLLASEAYAREPGVGTLSALQQVLSANGPFLGYVAGGTRYDAVEWADSGDVVVALGERGIETFDTTDFELIERVPLIPGLVVAPGSTQKLAALDVSTDGRYVAASTAFSGVILWDRSNGEQRVLEHDEDVLVVVFSNGGDLLATADSIGVVRVWRVPSGNLVFEVDAAAQADLVTDGVRGLVFTPDDRVLVTSNGPTVRQWGVADGTRPADEFDIVAHHPEFGPFPISAERLLMDPLQPEQLIVVADTGFGFHDLATGADLGGVGYPTDRTDLTIGGAAIAMRPEGGFVVYLDDGRVRAVGDDGEIVTSVDAQLSSPSGLDIEPDGRRYVAASADGLMVGSIDGSGLIARGIPRGSGTELSVSTDGTLVVSTETEAGNTILWKVLVDSIESLALPPGIADHATYVESHPSGELFGQFRVDEDFNFSFALLDATTGRETGVEIDECVGPAAYSADGVLAAFGCPSTGEILLFEVATGDSVARGEGFGDEANFGVCEACPVLRIRSLDFHPDGSRLIVTNLAGAKTQFKVPTMLRFDSTELYVSGRFDEDTGLGDTVVANFSPDGAWSVTIDDAGVIALRDPSNFASVRELRGGGRPIEELAFGPLFSADGRVLLSTSDGSARIWDVESGRRIGESFPNDIGVVANGAEGDLLQLVTGVGPHVLLWNLDLETWPEVACRAAGRNMTRTEWDAFGPSDTSYRATCPQYPIDPS